MDSKYAYVFLLCLLLQACGGGQENYDASGMFEAKTVIVASEISGRIEELRVKEGDRVEAGSCVGYIDTTQLYLLKLQAERGCRAVDKRIPDMDKQLEMTRRQLKKMEVERNRVEGMFRGGAATAKQVDDVETQLQVVKSMLAAQTNQLAAGIAGAHEEADVYALKMKQVEDQIRRCYIVNPISGTVLAKYTEVKELASPAKALYKIGDLKNMYLRVYVGSGELAGLKIGQQVEVYAQCGVEKYRMYPGKVSWISQEAEFTPKTVQTRDERENLVYAVKIDVENDGFLKIGMYADVRFGNTPQG